ncbi:MAG: glycosyltransferase family 1 protein [Cyanobacteria bacterium P01_F01_bin.3]
MTVFVNYYRQESTAVCLSGRSRPVRGGEVYTAVLARYLRSHGIDIFDVPWQKGKLLPDQLSQYLSFPYRRLAKRAGSQLVHLPSPFNPGCLALKGRTITTFHDQVNYDFYSRPTRGQRLLRQLEKLTAARTDYVISPSQFSAERTQARFPKFKDRTHVVYPGVSDVFFETRSLKEKERVLKKLFLLPSTPFLLYVGSTNPHKNHQSVVETYAQLLRHYPQMKLVMVGAIRERREFSSLVKDFDKKGLCLDANIVIPRETLSPLELSALYQSASVFLFPSFYEGWGIVVGEALASGTSAVISNIPVFRECFTGGALMVNPHSIEEMIGGVEAMLIRPELSRLYAQRGRKLVAERTWDNTAKATVDVYNNYTRVPQASGIIL